MNDLKIQIDDYINRIYNINFFLPSKYLERCVVDKKVELVMKSFEISAPIEYIKISNVSDLIIAWSDSVSCGDDWEERMNSAANDALITIKRNGLDKIANAFIEKIDVTHPNITKHNGYHQIWSPYWTINQIVKRSLLDLIAFSDDEYKRKYPSGNFLNIIDIFEMGLFPVGLINNKFTIYVPPYQLYFPDGLI